MSTGHCLGAFYHWKLELLALAKTIGASDGRSIAAFILRSDQSDYGRFESALVDGRGLLVSVPHHGHFVMSICALVEVLRRRREVHVFYDAPSAHPTNALFDAMHARMYGNADATVRILHNNRAGIAAAMQALRRGQVVILLPDVYRDVLETYQVSFCGTTRDVMLGAATLARRSGARILPLVSRPGKSPFVFESCFGEIVEPIAGDGTAEGDRHADFRSISLLFRRFESLMRDQLIFWQYARRHAGASKPASGISPDSIPDVASLLLRDPRIHVDVRSPICLDRTT